MSKSYTPDQILKGFFKKELKDRRESDVNYLSKYLSHKYTYFVNLKSTKDFNPHKISKIIKYAKLETIAGNKTIFNYGEPGNKFYILLQGSVSLYKPEYKEKYLTPYEFYKIVSKIKDFDLDILKYNRILEKNSQLLGIDFKNNDLSYLEQNKSYFNVNKKRFFLEKMEKIGDFKDGFAFGEMALIHNTARNATIKTNEKSLFLTIGKKDYNIAIREMHDKILGNDINKFLINYPIFKIFPKEMILNILNNLSRKTIYKGEYLFHEGEESNNIYFLQNGTINLSFNISLAWFDDYLKYFNDSSTNMIIYLINEKPSTFSKIITEIEAKTKEINGKHDINLFFKHFDNSKKWEKCLEKVNENNFIGLKTEEDKINKNNTIFKLNYKDINEHEIISLEDSIECKKRFFTAKCVSEHADLLIIHTQNLLRICTSLKENQLLNFLKFILKRKDIQIAQIINKIKQLGKDILFSLDNKYDKLKGDENKISKESDIDKIISLIKFKGFKSNINELLDRNINISDLINHSVASKSFNLQMFNSPSKETINKNEHNKIVLKKIHRDINTKKYMLKAKTNINMMKNINSTFLDDPKWKAFIKHSKKYKNKNKKAKMILFSPISNSDKYKLFSREKTYDNLNATTKSYFNSYFSPNKKSNGIELFSKIFPNVIKNQRNISKDIPNKLLDVNSSPFINSSYNNTDTADNENKINKNEIKSEKKENLFTKIYKMKNNININSPKSKDILKTEGNNYKNRFLSERNFYNKLMKEKKSFYLGERFNKKLLYEFNTFRPKHYKSFLMKSK